MDRALVERAKAGDHEAFGALARASSGRLYAAATLILRDPDAAEDAVQEALISAWRGVRALRDPDAWDAWLHRLVVRACYRLARRSRRPTVVELHLAEEEGASSSDILLSLADRDQLERAFARLPIEQRSILVLHYYLGLALPEVGNVLGIPTGTVKSRLHRATQAMRAALDADARATLTVGEQVI
jgi:RNA polymerase sigma-70 factor (ECF subfamily)